MARGKRKTKAFEQGAIREIYEWFFRPLLKLKPYNINFHDWLDAIFCTQDRIIERYVAVEPFKMPGRYWAAPNVLVEGMGNRDIKAGYDLWVRRDKTMPDRIDVETWTGQGMRQNIFALTRKEYDQILPKIKFERFRKFKRAKYSWES